MNVVALPMVSVRDTLPMLFISVVEIVLVFVSNLVYRMSVRMRLIV